MASIAFTLQRIKDDLQSFLPETEIQAVCRDVGYTWRERKCGPVKTIHLFIRQILCFNTAMTHLRLLAKAAVTAPTYCRARMRLPFPRDEFRSAAERPNSAAGRPGWASCRGKS